MDIGYGAVAVRPAARERIGAAGETAARVLLGLLFTASGLSGFALLVLTLPPSPGGLAGAFQDVFFRSHWAQFVDGVQLIAGVLLLANRYVTLALTLLGAILANILFFHLSMQPQTIAIPLVVTALWLFLANRHRATMRVIFTK
jgi:hypothetical protein